MRRGKAWECLGHRKNCNNRLFPSDYSSISLGTTDEPAMQDEVRMERWIGFDTVEIDTVGRRLVVSGREMRLEMFQA